MHIIGIVHALETLGHSVELLSPPGIDPREEAGSYLYQKPGQKEKKVRLLWRFLSRHAPEAVFEIAELCYNLVGLVRLIRCSKRSPVDLIYERYAFFLWAGVLFARWKRIPLILEVNEVSGVARARKQILVGIARFIESNLFRSADTIVVVSSFLKETLVKRDIEPGKIIVIPNGVNHQKFHPKLNGDGIRQKWGVEKRIVFGFVGWFDPWDELPFLIDVFEEVFRLRPHSALVLVGNVVGKGPGLKELQEKIQQRGLDKGVVLAGPVPREHMPETIAAMDVGVIPHSNPFGSPVALFEFMACGKPVIASALGPLKDVLRQSENGLLFSPKDKTSFQEMFLRLIDNPEVRAEIGVLARKSILQEHTWEAKTRKILAFYEKQQAPCRKK